MNERPAVLAQLRKGVIEYCVLAELQRGSSYGLALAARLGEQSTLFDSGGVIYPLLARMRKAGWVETHWQESDAGPPRRYYQISSTGEEALSAFLEAWHPFVSEATSVLDGGKRK